MTDQTATTAGASNTIPTTASTTATSTGDDVAKPLELEHTFTDFDDVEQTVAYHFRKPSRPQISRAQNSMRKDPMNGLRMLCLDCVVAEEKSKLKADLDKYDGLAGTFGNEILGRVGFGDLGK